MYTCSISLETPKLPVFTNSGQIYDFNSIATHILKNSPSDPTSRVAIEHITHIRGIEFKPEKIDIDETCELFMRLVNQFPHLRIYGVAELSILAERLEPVNSFVQSLPVQPYVKGITLFHLAAHHNNLPCMKALHDAGIVNLNAISDDHITALHLACIAQNVKVVEWLLSKNLDINMILASNKATPLHYAIAKNNFKIVAMLAKKKNLDLSLRTLDGLTPIEYAIHYDQNKMLDILLMSSENMAAGMIYAKVKGKTQFIETFLEYYIHQMIHNPRKSSRSFIDDMIYVSTDTKYQNLLWDLMIKPSARLNLSAKFPHQHHEKQFCRKSYFTWLKKEFKKFDRDPDSAHRLFLAFDGQDLEPKINYLVEQILLSRKDTFFKDKSSSMKQIKSLPNLSSGMNSF